MKIKLLGRTLAFGTTRPKSWNVTINAVNQAAKAISMDTTNCNSVDEVMCHCSGTKRKNIQNLFEQGLDIHAISRWTGALSGCGGCEWDIAQLLKDLAEYNSPESPSD